MSYPGGISPTGGILFLSERPVFIQQEIDREAQAVIDECDNFFGNVKNRNPQQRKQTAENDARQAVCNVYLYKGFFPRCLRGTEDIAPVEPKGPSHADHKAEKQRYKEIKAGKPFQHPQTPQCQIVHAQIHKGTAEAHQSKEQNLYHRVSLPSTNMHKHITKNRRGQVPAC